MLKLIIAIALWVVVFEFFLRIVRGGGRNDDEENERWKKN